MSAISKDAAIAELWRRGFLSFKLDSNQKALYKLFHDSDHKIQVWLLARRSGKSHTLFLMATEQCIRHARSIIKFVAPTKSQVNVYAKEVISNLLDDCPEDVKPTYRQRDYTFVFPNGSEIHLAGSESGHAERLRGSSAHIGIVDEAGDVTNLKDIIESVLLPSTLTTDGKILIAGTAPKSEDHDFAKVIEAAELRGALVVRTVYDNPRLTPKQVADMIAEMGGELGIKAERVRRELFCEIVKSADLSVVPEFTAELQKEVTKEWPEPPFYDCYVSMDLGMKDLTAVLFGYYDFRADKLIIQDELDFKFNIADGNIRALSDTILGIEAKLWTNPLTNEQKKPYLRVSDINPIVTNEIIIQSQRRLVFANPIKYDKDAAINEMRMLLASRKIIINPKCRILLRHLRNVKWNKTKQKFARSPDDAHYDFVDALIYMIRAVQRTKNPYPKHYETHLRSEDVFKTNKNALSGQSSQVDVFRQIFNSKPRHK